MCWWDFFFYSIIHCHKYYTTTFISHCIPLSTMSLLTINTCTTPPRQEKSLDTTTATAVTPRPCPTPTQIGDVNQTIHPMQLGDLLDRISYMKLNSVVTSNFCDGSSSISSLSVAASERDCKHEDEEGLFVDDSVRHEDRDKKEVKPSLKRCSKTFCFVPTIHDSPPQTAKRMRLNY